MITSKGHEQPVNRPPPWIDVMIAGHNYEGHLESTQHGRGGLILGLAGSLRQIATDGDEVEVSRIHLLYDSVDDAGMRDLAEMEIG